MNRIEPPKPAEDIHFCREQESGEVEDTQQKIDRLIADYDAELRELADR
ncbi:hypothetical protein H5A40_17175 [Pectobacterium brasiliense]|nr:hypothetical protein [Pectobacterium brasiliense]QSD34784.1 hypothetical protein H5A40_17175 [Pectobacterium brasiliense]